LGRVIFDGGEERFLAGRRDNVVAVLAAFAFSSCSALTLSSTHSSQTPTPYQFGTRDQSWASPTMVGPVDPETDSAKLDRILAQLTTINKRLDSHDRRIARKEKF